VVARSRIEIYKHTPFHTSLLHTLKSLNGSKGNSAGQNWRYDETSK
jgi:hypothetical protein